MIDLEYQVETVEFIDVPVDKSSYPTITDPTTLPVEMALIPEGNILNRDTDFVAAAWLIDTTALPSTYTARVKVGLAGSTPTPAIAITANRYRVYTRVTGSTDKPVKRHGYVKFTQEQGVPITPAGTKDRKSVV